MVSIARPFRVNLRTTVDKVCVVIIFIGELGIICIEDVIHEILATTNHFKTVNAFLWNFQLSPPAGGWNKRRAVGPCGENINVLLKRAI